LSADLDIEIADIDSFAAECFEQVEQTVTESMIIVGLITGADQAYECMQVIRARRESAMSALTLAQPFDRLVRARGYSDRRTLLDMLAQATQIREWSIEMHEWFHEQAVELSARFWRQFVIDGSAPPEVDLEQWRF
jgi:hypothetical protein